MCEFDGKEPLFVERIIAISIRVLGWSSRTRPCRPTLEQVEMFSWTDPLSLFHLFHDDLKTPFSLFHLFHVDLKTRFSLYLLFHVLQLVPTCTIWLYHLFFANSRFSDFFWVSQCHSIFRKTLLTEIFLQNIIIMLERANNKKISTTRQRQPWPYAGSHGFVLFRV